MIFECFDLCKPIPPAVQGRGTRTIDGFKAEESNGQAR